MCEKCKDTGRIFWSDEFGYPNTQECPDCTVRTASAVYRKHCGLIGSELDAKIEMLDPHWGPDTKNLISHVQAVLDKQLPWLSIIGSTGNGKTTSLWAITSYFVNLGVPARYTSVPDLFGYLKAGFNDTELLDAEQRLDILKNIRVLCLDEADKMTGSEWQREQFYRLVDHRWRLAKRKKGEGRAYTIFAMNKEPQDDYLRSRLLDSQFAYVRIFSPDVRLTEPSDMEWK